VLNRLLRRAPGRPGLVVRGSFRGVSGHDRHVRAFVRGLAAEGVAVRLVDLPQWAPTRLPAEARDPWFERLDRRVGARAVIHFCMPHQVSPVRGRLNVNYTMFEASRVPAHWVALNCSHHLVVVPTPSARDAWLESGFPEEQIRICPLGVDGEQFRPGVPPLPLADRRGEPLSSYRARFLTVAEHVPRKNLLGLVRTWIRATRADDDAVLIIKLSHDGGRRTLAFLAAIAGIERDLGKRREEAAPIVFVDRPLADDAMPALYAAATHYWSMSCGEAWDLAMCEAGACGLQLIAPRHSAYLAYLDDTRAWLIPAHREPVDPDVDWEHADLFQGAEWWRPDEEAAAERIEAAIGAPDDRLPSARDWLLAHCSWQTATRRLIDLLGELHAARGYRF